MHRMRPKLMHHHRESQVISSPALSKDIICWLCHLDTQNGTAQLNRPENNAATTVTIIKVAMANVLENNSIYWLGLDLNKTDV